MYKLYLSANANLHHYAIYGKQWR